MDTTNPTLKRVHETLFDDLGKLGQLIDPLNDRALAVTYQALNHLGDLEKLIDPDDDGPEAEETATLGPRSFLWHDHPGDTLDYCSAVLQGLCLVTDGAEVTSQKQRFGIYIILESVCQALDYWSRRVTRRETSEGGS